MNWSDTLEKGPKVYKILCCIFICAKCDVKKCRCFCGVVGPSAGSLVTVTITQMTIAHLTLLLQQARGPTTTLSMRRVSPTWNTCSSKTIHIQTRKNSTQDSNNAPPATRCSSWYQEAESPVNRVVIRHECAPRTIVHEEHHWGFQPTEQVSMLIHHNRWTSVGYTCWYPLMQMVDMPRPPLRLIPAITNHYRVTHCKLATLRIVHHAWLVFVSPSFPTHGATGRSECGLDAPRTTMLKIDRSWHEAYCSTTSKGFAAGVVRTTHCTHPLSWLARRFGPTSSQPPRWMMDDKGQCGCVWFNCPAWNQQICVTQSGDRCLSPVVLVSQMQRTHVWGLQWCFVSHCGSNF